MIIDIKAIGLVAHGDGGGAQFFKHFWRYVVGCPMGTVKYYFHARQSKAGWQAAFTEFNITTRSIGNTSRLAKVIGIVGDQWLIQQRFDFQFDFVGQFVAVSTEKLNPIVFE